MTSGSAAPANEQGWANALRHVANLRVDRRSPYPDALRSIVSAKALSDVKAEITTWPGYAPTPLVPLEGWARALGVEAVHYKDEAERFSLQSFKALGGAYAVLRVLLDHLARRHGISNATATDLISRRYASETAVAVACATDGNHGRSVAWGAQMFGCTARIYIHAGVSAEREAAIAAYGATMVRLAGDYDASVRQCGADAAANGWTLVADTDAGGGDPWVPRAVMQGYALIVDELQTQLERAPTHVFIPAGVGGLAAAIAGHWWETAGTDRPRMVTVEPLNADCLQLSLAAGEMRSCEGPIDSFMACLAAGTVSPSAWPLIVAAIDDTLAIPDETAVSALAALAAPPYGDAVIEAGESASASLAGLAAAAHDPAVRAALDLGPHARIVLIGTEGPTDPAAFERVTGRPPTR